MARPRERYRYGARRRQQSQLDPVFVLEERNGGYGTGVYQVITGDLGLVADLNVFGNQWPASPQPSVQDPGLLNAITTYITGFPNTSVSSTSFNAPVSNRCNLLFAFQHHETLYLSINRIKFIEYRASLVYTVANSTNEYIEAGEFFSNAIDNVGDIITYQINLTNGQIQARNAVLLAGEIAIVFSGNPGEFYDHNVIDARTRHFAYLQMFASLPDAHPLKIYGSDLWQGLQPTNTTSYPYVNDNIRLNKALNNCLGYGSEPEMQRIIKKSNVIEWADVSYSNLAQAKRLGEAWSDSFTAYSDNDLKLREDLLVVEGLSLADQAAFLNTISPAPAVVSPGAIAGGITGDANYFLESPSMQAEGGLSLNTGLFTSLRYRILT